MTGWTDADRAAVRDRVTAVLAEFGDVEVADAHGHTGFLCRGKRFAWLLADHHGDGRLALWLKAPPGEQQALVSADARRYFVPPYLGPKGWVGVNVDPGSDPDWEEIRGLVEQAWRVTAGKRAVAVYDAKSATESR